MISYRERESVVSELQGLVTVAEAYDRCTYAYRNHDAEEAAMYRSIQSCIRDGNGSGHVYTIGRLIKLIEQPRTTLAIPKDSSFRDADGNYLGTYKCLLCGAEVWADLDSVTPYCPMCGAKVVE